MTIAELLARYSGTEIDELRVERAALVLRIRQLQAQLYRLENDLASVDHRLQAIADRIERGRP